MIKEFKKFIMRGNVIDMAVGVVIGTAFAKIVSSLVADIIMPPIGFITGGVDFSNLVITLQKASEGQEGVMIHYGVFINNIIDFLIIAFVIFITINQFSRFQKKEEQKPSEPSEEILLLREIRDVLKK